MVLIGSKININQVDPKVKTDQPKFKVEMDLGHKLKKANPNQKSRPDNPSGTLRLKIEHIGKKYY